ncbi:glucosaminidase domain-containing protein [Candidatus Pelagibacter sp.]|nr:glucosaminidase domain-containing protein [Candidatus Pelagibacter sp.]
MNFMIKKNSQMDFEKIKKFLSKKGYRLIKKKGFSHQLKYKNIYTTSFASLIVITFFYILPLSINKVSSIIKHNKHVENYSKKYLEKVLSGENLVSGELENDEIAQRYLYEDVELKEGPSKSVRIEASILNQLFEDNDYNLKKVRVNKIVKPFEVGMLPEELKNIESTKKRKDLFIKIVLPLILSENNRILRDRDILFKILNKNNNTKSERQWLNKKFKQYGVVNKDVTTLKIRMDIIPVSLALAQAAKESGWGTSRFAIEGNALFGQWTYSGEGITPAAADKGDKHKVMAFSVLKSSVRAYQRNLNTHKSYKVFRKERATQRDNEENLDSTLLANYLNSYAETGEEYVKILKQIINQNNLKDFDKAKILPSSKSLQNNI